MSKELIRKPKVELEKSRAELEVQDELFAILLNKHDRAWKIGDMFWCKYTRGSSGTIYAKLVGLRWRAEEGDTVEGYGTPENAPKWHENNIVVTLYHPDYETEYYKTPYYELTLGKMFDGYKGIRYVGDEANIQKIKDDVKAIANQEVTIEKLVEAAFPPTEMSEQTGLMVMNTDVILERKRDLLQKQQFINIRIAQAKDLLEQRKWQLQQFTSGLMVLVEKLNRLIYSIELFMGIKEELIQFGFGPTAPADDPICFRQRLLYMDEEVGDPTDDFKGIDFNKIDAFDEWLMKFNPYWKCYNYEMMIPESKCVVIFRVRRNPKEYDPNPFINGYMNQANMLTYVLIRNGGNIFRVYADIVMGEKLFPDSDELTDLMQTMDGKEFENESDIKRKYRDVQTAEEILERYRLNMILFQGIIERTPCFPDNAGNINIFAKEGYGDKIKYIYDATEKHQLPTNTPTFFEWLDGVNSNIKEGSKILWNTDMFWKNHKGYNRDERLTRYFKVRYSEHSVPNAPENGLYQVYGAKMMTREQEYTRTRESSHGHKEREDACQGVVYTDVDRPENVRVRIPPQPYLQLFIKHNPGGNRNWSWSDDWDANITRKNRLSWAIHKDDRCILNWEAISRRDLELMEFYLYTRIGRTKYLSYIPMIMEVFKEKKAEMKGEDDFIRLCLSQAGLDPEDYFGFGVKAMDWWKLKNKWKRNLSVDDSKALRMIVKKLKSAR